jgi:hypothetical protein
MPAAALGNQARMSLVLWLDALSITTWMSRLAGTFDFIKELAELPRAVARHALSDDRSRFHIESSELSALRHSRF